MSDGKPGSSYCDSSRRVSCFSVRSGTGGFRNGGGTFISVGGGGQFGGGIFKKSKKSENYKYFQKFRNSTQKSWQKINDRKSEKNI